MHRPEQVLQQQIAAFLQAAYPSLVWFHPPNGGARSKVEGAIFKAMGVKPGVPDLVFVLPDGRAAFLELKAGRGRLSPAQEGFLARIDKLGCPWASVRSLAEAAHIIERWLAPFGCTAKARIS